jgi:hypothetical protein
MPVFQPFTGMPGVSAEKLSKHRVITSDGYLEFLPGGLIIDGTKTRDPDNPDYPTDLLGQTRLRAGLLMGKVTASGKYANSVLGVTQGAYTSGGTSITVSAAEAVEIVRRIGSSGNLKFIGPPSAAGTVAVITQAFSAVNTTTGVITITSLGANLVTGAFIAPTDGSETPLTFLPDGWELPLPADGTSDMPFDKPPVAGNLIGSNLLPWPADTSLRTWVRAGLNTNGQFVFTELY